MDRPTFLMTDPAGFDVSYRINPWMKPDAWRDADARAARAARAGSDALRRALEGLGAKVETIGAVKGLPDLVFPANAGVVLDGTVTPARFRHPERQGEEPVFRAVFQRLKAVTRWPARWRARRCRRGACWPRRPTTTPSASPRR